MWAIQSLMPLMRLRWRVRMAPRAASTSLSILRRYSKASRRRSRETRLRILRKSYSRSKSSASACSVASGSVKVEATSTVSAKPPSTSQYQGCHSMKGRLTSCTKMNRMAVTMSVTRVSQRSSALAKSAPMTFWRASRSTDMACPSSCGGHQGRKTAINCRPAGVDGALPTATRPGRCRRCLRFGRRACGWPIRRARLLRRSWSR